MKNQLFYTSIILTIIITFYGCLKKESEVIPEIAPEISISGTAQKGPFLIGSSITVFELNQQYSQTGNSYSTQISDNLGNFQLNNISLTSNYLKIRVDGYYFNEICGSNSTSQITLNCISNITNSASLNINLLTHIEKPRVEHLLTTGMSFESAKNQAQEEILNIFNISSSNIQNSEHLDISQNGEGNAILLAISSILQGFRSESELSTLLSVISNDISSDGTLDDTNTKSSLIDHALLLDTISIRNNISNFYSNLSINAPIPNFEKYILQFINNSNFTITNSAINYPTTGINGPNILSKSQLTYNGFYNKSVAGQGSNCSYIKIRMTVLTGARFGLAMGSDINLAIGNFNTITNEQYFTVIDPALPFDLHIIFDGPPPMGGGGSYLIEYFEKDISLPTFSKTITVNA